VTREQNITSAGRKRRNLWLVIILALVFCSAAIYLYYPEIDWTKKFAALPEPPGMPPAGQAPAPALLAPSFDAVSADESGMLVAAGKAQAGSTVLLKNGAQTLDGSKADENGEWVLILKQPLPAGNYDLSLLAIDPKTQASVPSRHSFALTIAPHGKGAPAMAAATAQPNAEADVPGKAGAAGPESQPQKPAKVAAVKRGDTLWRLAHRFYGKGMRYNEIAGANKAQIKDPNRIFPNQQLSIP